MGFSLLHSGWTPGERCLALELRDWQVLALAVYCMTGLSEVTISVLFSTRIATIILA